VKTRAVQGYEQQQQQQQQQQRGGLASSTHADTTYAEFCAAGGSDSETRLSHHGQHQQQQQQQQGVATGDADVGVDVSARELARTSSPFGVQDQEDDNLGAAAAAQGADQGRPAAAAAGSLREPQVSASAPNKLQPVVSLDVASAPAPNRAATEPARLVGPPAAAATAAKGMRQPGEQAAHLAELAGQDAWSAAAAGQAGAAAKASQGMGVSIGREVYAASPEPSPLTEATISSTGAEAGWTERADSASPAAVADAAPSPSHRSDFGGKWEAAPAVGGKSGGRAAKQEKGSFWGRLFQCCAAPSVKE
jgi:hypothetical protein